MNKLRNYALLGAMALAPMIYSGCNALESSVRRMDERLDGAKFYQVPSRIFSGAKDIVCDLPEQSIPGADPSRPGYVVENIRENKLLDIGTDAALGAGLGAVAGTSNGLCGASGNTPESIWRGIGIGAAAGAASNYLGNME